MKKVSLVSRALAFVQGGDEAKLTRFESKLQKFFRKQKSMREEQITNLREKIADAYETVNETVVSVAADRIKDTDSAEFYCATYVKSVEAKLDAVDALQTQIDTLEAEIAKFDKIEAAIYSVETSVV